MDKIARIRKASLSTPVSGLPSMAKIACIGGGSGGHILPIVMLHDRLRRSLGIDCVWIGEAGGMDENKAREHEIEFYPIQGLKFRRQFSLRNLLQPYFFFKALHQSHAALKTIRPTAIFCKGGGVALPVGICARMMRIPLYVHESDTIPGLTNRVVGFFAKRVFLGFEWAKRFFPWTPTEFVGQWIDPIFTEYIASHPFARKNDGYSTRMVVQCGGLGSTMIFEQLLACVTKFPSVHFTVALGTLNEHFYERFARYPNVYVKKWFFHEELAAAYADADIALVRAAATTLAECELFGLRIVMVPLGISSFDHQYHNAVEYQKINPEHVLLPESELANLENVIESLKNFRKESYGKNVEAVFSGTPGTPKTPGNSEIPGNPLKTMKSEVDFEYRSEAWHCHVERGTEKSTRSSRFEGISASAMERVLPALLSEPSHPNP